MGISTICFPASISCRITSVSKSNPSLLRSKGICDSAWTE